MATNRTYNWPMIAYIGTCHAAALIGLFALRSCRYTTIAIAVVCYWLGGLGITAGAHRLWSHRSYKACDAIRFFLMLCQSIANQGSIIHWCRDHRVHHKYSDTEADPHNSGRGFFFSHMGWLLVKKSSQVVTAGGKLDYQDLYDDWVVAFQQKYNPWVQVLMCFVFPTWITVHLTHETVWNALFITGFLRYVILLHATWLVNSAAHFYGYRPYEANPPRENWLVSLFALGEGWHNYHHKFPYDYATSEFGIWKQMNPTKLFIDLLASLGLVWDRKRAVNVWERIKQTRLQEKVTQTTTTAFSELKAKSN